MDHADVRAWLEEAFFRPGVLRRLDEGELTDPGLEPLRDHLRGCPACAGELRSLRATSVALDVGLGPAPAAAERTVARIRQVGRPRPVAVAGRPAGRSVALGRLSPLSLAAVLAVLLLAFAAGALIGFGWPAAEPQEGPRLANATRVLGQLWRAQDAQQVWLYDDGAATAGLVVYARSEQRLAVVAAGFQRDEASGYECFLERDGQRSWIGPMHFEGETGFWAGPLEEPADAGRPGDRFLVLAGDSGPPVLSGEFR